VKVVSSESVVVRTHHEDRILYIGLYSASNIADMVNMVDSYGPLYRLLLLSQIECDIGIF